MMKSALVFCLIIAFVAAGPPILPRPGDPQDFLAPNCRTPKCPTTKTDTPVNLPYPLDCLQYIICEESGPRTAGCPGDLVFNRNTGQCDTRQNANCVPCWQRSD